MNLFSASVAYASVDSLVSKINTVIINPIIVLLFALAVMYFLYGVFQFILNQENEENRTNGKNHMIWGVIGMVVMMGVFAIMDLISATLGVPTIDR